MTFGSSFSSFNCEFHLSRAGPSSRYQVIPAAEPSDTYASLVLDTNVLTELLSYYNNSFPPDRLASSRIRHFLYSPYSTIDLMPSAAATERCWDSAARCPDENRLNDVIGQISALWDAMEHHRTKLIRGAVPRSLVPPKNVAS